jgi:two-component system nitrate/nitrite response regulator NarL
VAEASRIRVGVVDDHDLLVAGVRALLSARNSPAEFVVGAPTVRGLLLHPHQLDVVVLDVRLNDGSTPQQNVDALSDQGYRVILHADHTHREALPVLERSRACGLVWKTEPALALVQAIVTVAEGGTWEPRSDQRRVDLTHRETEVLELYATGMTYAQTAAALKPPVSVESVKTYLTRIRKRYDEAGRPASTRMELRERALEDGLIPPETGS